MSKATILIVLIFVKGVKKLPVASFVETQILVIYVPLVIFYKVETVNNATLQWKAVLIANLTQHVSPVQANTT